MSESSPSPARYWLTLFRDWALAGVVVVAAFATWNWITSPLPLSAGPAPDFTLPRIEGGDFQLSDLEDRTVVLNFWFTDCGPCRGEIPELSAWAAMHPDVPVVGVSTDRLDINQLRARSRQLGVNYTVVHDALGRVSRDYSVSVFPTTVVVKDGEVKLVRVGAINRTTLDTMMKQVGG